MKSTFATKYEINENGVFRVFYSILPYFVEKNYTAVISTHNTKLGQIPSFNTLPGNISFVFDDFEILGTCAQICRGCYGMKSQYNMSGAVNAEALNTLLMRSNMAGVFAQIKDYCLKEKPEEFRIHANGDFLNFDEFRGWLDLARECPDTCFYGYTKNYDWLDLVLSMGMVPDNFVCNISVFDGYGEKIAKELFLKYIDHCNIFIAEYEHREHFDDLLKKVCKCPAYVRRIKKNGKPGAVVLMHGPEDDPDRYTCKNCGLCRRTGLIISTLIH